MDIFEFSDVKRTLESTGGLWHEFFQIPALSMGIYSLPAGIKDPQQPHTEDEVYYVVSGRGQIHVAGEDREVQPGTVVFVAANDSHYFHSIEEDLELLVIFAPAEGSLATNRS